MKRKQRMGGYIERICKLLQNLPVTRANEIECKALWDNIALSHLDIANKITNNEGQSRKIMESKIRKPIKHEILRCEICGDSDRERLFASPLTRRVICMKCAKGIR